MTDHYIRSRGYPYIGTISAETARHLYETLKDDPDSFLKGDLATGFTYTSTYYEGIHLVRVHVYPERTAQSRHDNTPA